MTPSREELWAVRGEFTTGPNVGWMSVGRGKCEAIFRDAKEATIFADTKNGVAQSLPLEQAQGSARDIVTEWIGMFDPPPQIDFQQSEFLQGAIAHAMAPSSGEVREALEGLLAWTGATREGITDPEERCAFEDDLAVAKRVLAGA
jgi:hypothetical protein